MTWAGLKGGLCLALIMGSSKLMEQSTYNLFVIATYFIVLFTTVVQGLTVGKGYTILNRRNEKSFVRGKKKVTGHTVK
jgi:CPA1 family monovalent cation:H+ antiporter